MKMVTTKAIAKVAAVATGLAMATSMLSFASVANAASLTSAQVQSILSLLSSFGANSATIANVNSALTGAPVTTTSGSTTTTTSSCSVGTADLKIGSSGAAVTCLQQTLISKGYAIAAGATGRFGAQTKMAVSKWQMAVGITPTAGYFGAKSRAAFGGGSSSSSSTTTTTTTTGPSAGTGTGLKIMLSPTSPNGTVLVQGQAIGNLADFVFTNPTSAPINVTALSFKRTGVSNDSTLTNVYLYWGGTRITDSAGVSASAFSYSDPVALFTVPAGGTYTVSVRSDIAGSTSGQQIGVSLVSATSNGTLDSSVSFPVMSGYQTVSAANLAAVDYNAPTASPTVATSISPQNDYSIWQETINVSTNPVKLSSMRFTNLGSIDSGLLINLRLYVDGVQAGSAVASASSNRTITFDLSTAPILLSTSAHTVKVLANITGGASRTVQLSVQRASDAMFVDNQLGQPVTPTKAGSTFGAITTGVITINSVSGSTGVSVSRNPSSPNQAVAVGATNIEWARFDMLASGENVKVNDLFVSAATSIHAGGLTNGKVMVNGVQVGSTKSIGETTPNTTDFGLGSSLILPAGQTTTVSIFADAKTSTSTNLSTNETVTVSIDAGTSNAQGQMSLNSANVPGAKTSGNTITVSSSSLIASKYTGYGNQTVVPGSNNAKLGSFVLSTGSTEGVTVNTISITLTAASAASITNLTLKDSMTGTVLGTVITTPAGSSNQFSVNVPIALSSSKTFDIYGNVLSGANIGTIAAQVDANTTGVGSVTGISTSAALTTLQTITVGTGVLTVTRGAGDPTSNNVLAGASSVLVGSFNFASQNSQYTVQNLAVVIPNSVATSVTAVTVSYKDVNGATQTQTQGLAVNPLMPFATATFTGLTMYVPVNDSSDLNVYVGTPTIASGATAGAPLNVSLDTGNASTAIDNTFRAVNSAGSPSTVAIAASTYMASNGTFYVRKSIPTFAMLATTNTVPSTGTPLYRFTITADPAGAIEWSHLKFNISTNTANVSNVYLTDDATGVSLLDSGTFASTTATTITVDLPTSNVTLAKFVQVVGTKTYSLYGTVASYGAVGSTISIGLAADTGAVANNAALAGVAQSSGVIWSDRSSTSHSISSTDWTNGYLLKNFTSNTTSYSK